MGITQLEIITEYKRITGNCNFINLEEEIDFVRSTIKTIYNKINLLEKDKEKIINRFKNNEIDIDIFKDELKKYACIINKIKKDSRLSILQHDLIMLENMPNTLKIIPSIIDYAINVGMNETSEQWIDFLISNKSLDLDILHV